MNDKRTIKEIKHERLVNACSVCMLYLKHGYIKTVHEITGFSNTTIRKYLKSFDIKIKPNNDKTRFGKMENHHKWNGGVTRTTSGYTALRVGKHKYIGEHILIMEKHIGRKLVSGEVVHHINEKRGDNRIENLMLMSSSDHTRLHNTGRVHSEQTKKMQSEIKKGVNQKEKHQRWKHSITKKSIISALNKFKLKKDAAKYLGIGTDTMRAREKYYGIYRKKTIPEEDILNGIKSARSFRDAARIIGVDPKTLKTKLKDINKTYEGIKNGKFK